MFMGFFPLKKTVPLLICRDSNGLSIIFSLLENHTDYLSTLMFYNFFPYCISFSFVLTFYNFDHQTQQYMFHSVDLIFYCPNEAKKFLLAFFFVPGQESKAELVMNIYGKRWDIVILRVNKINFNFTKDSHNSY